MNVPPDNPWEQASLPGCYTRLLSEWLAGQQYPAKRLREAIEAVDAGARVSLMKWFEWLQQVQGFGVEPVQFLGIGANARRRHFGLLGHLIACHATLGDALRSYHDFERLQYGVSVSELIDTHGERPVMRWRLPQNIAYLPAEAIALASMHRFLVNVLAIPAPFTEIHFASDGAGEAERFSEFFHCRVFFNRADCGVVFAPHALQHRLPADASGMQARLTDSTLCALDIANDADPNVRQILALLPRYLHEGGALAQRVSAELGLSQRSLHHRLSSTPWQFRELLGSVRQQAAIYYLNAPDLSLTEVAFLLGFSEQSAFQRAFRHWFGTTPGIWRRQHSSSA